MPAPTETLIIHSATEIAPAPHAWICDIWGVIHNGVAASPSAVRACLDFRANGGHIIYVSNAPRPSDGVVSQLNALGVPAEAYDAVLTSGDVTREALAAWSGVPTLHIGPERDLTLFKSLAIPLVDTARAERILCSGLYDDTTETPEHYRPQLTTLRARNVPMLCANPDIKVDRGGRIIYCAGAVAKLYEDLGGTVDFAGKPYPPVYRMARTMIAKLAGRAIPDADILAIGDGVHTDIAGGLSEGFRTVYVSSAIHHDGDLTPAALLRLFPEPSSRPQFAMAALA